MTSNDPAMVKLNATSSFPEHFHLEVCTALLSDGPYYRCLPSSILASSSPITVGDVSTATSTVRFSFDTPFNIDPYSFSQLYFSPVRSGNHALPISIVHDLLS